MSSWNDPEFCELFKSRTPLIDVRAPIEFLRGSIPHSVNLPLMDDMDRHLIGIEYKERGQEAAIKLGHERVSGSVKNQRIAAWTDFIKANPNAEVFCFRGGLRSQISCQWISEAGLIKRPIKGGYKRLRQFFLSWLNEAPLPEVIRLGGLTGSGKTTLLKKIPHHIDIESLALHRGSAFGYLGVQPSQIRFENELALKFMEFPNKLVVEDESAILGKVAIPKRFFTHMRASKLVILHASVEERARNIYQDYVLGQESQFFLSAIHRISKRLGGALHKELVEKITHAFAGSPAFQKHEEWISLLLVHYYDPIYKRDLERQKDKILFEGNQDEVLDWFRKF
jgi:tRNA 2-selenouridine synthase